MPRLIAAAVIIALWAAACASNEIAADVEPPAPITGEAMQDLLSDSAQPIVLNVWASWCTPCRSEAPLLRRAADEFGADVRFIGLDVRDTPAGATAFIAEFLDGAPIEHFADPSGAVPTMLGGSRGVPLTFFYRPGGELAHLHRGAIDERTIALQIDEIVNG